MRTHILMLSAIFLPVVGCMSKGKVTLLVCLSILVIASVLLSIKKVTNN